MNTYSTNFLIRILRESSRGGGIFVYGLIPGGVYNQVYMVWVSEFVTVVFTSLIMIKFVQV